MWSLELGAPPEIVRSGAIERAHLLRALAFKRVLAVILKPVAVMIGGKTRRRAALPGRAPAAAHPDGAFDPKSESVAAIGSAADARREYSPPPVAAPVRPALSEIGMTPEP